MFNPHITSSVITQSGLLHRAMWKSTARNCFGRGRHFQKTPGRWLESVGKSNLHKKSVRRRKTSSAVFCSTFNQIYSLVLIYSIYANLFRSHYWFIRSSSFSCWPHLWNTPKLPVVLQGTLIVLKPLCVQPRNKRCKMALRDQTPAATEGNASSWESFPSPPSIPHTTNAAVLACTTGF